MLTVGFGRGRLSVMSITVERLREEVEDNLRLIGELSERIALIRQKLEPKLLENPVRQSRVGLVSASPEQDPFGFGYNLKGQYSWGSLKGEYELNFFAPIPSYSRLQSESPLGGRVIAIQGFMVGLGTIDCRVKSLGDIKRLDRDGLVKLRDEVAVIEFLLETIGLQG